MEASVNALNIPSAGWVQNTVDLEKAHIDLDLECETCLRNPVKKPDGTEKLILTC